MSSNTQTPTELYWGAKIAEMFFIYDRVHPVAKIMNEYITSISQYFYENDDHICGRVRFLWSQLDETPFSRGEQNLAGWNSMDESKRGGNESFKDNPYTYEEEEEDCLVVPDYEKHLLDKKCRYCGVGHMKQKTPDGLYHQLHENCGGEYCCDGECAMTELRECFAKV